MSTGNYPTPTQKSFSTNKAFHQFKLLYLVVLSWMLVACGGSYTIHQPTKDSVHTNFPDTLKVGYDKQPTQLPAMVLNGLNVEHFFVAGEKFAVASGSDLSNYFIEGRNTFHVNPPLGPSVSFIYDSVGPSIILLGAEEDGLMKINGLAIDEMGVSSIFVNGTRVFVHEDGTFAANVLPAETYTYRAEDRIGHISVTDYANLGTMYDPSLTVNISQGGLDYAVDEVVNVINGLDMNSLMAGAPLYDKTTIGPLGGTWGFDGYIRQIDRFSVSDFNIDLANGGQAGFDARISNMHLKIALRSHNGLAPPVIINMGANVGPIEITGDLDFDVVEQTPEISIFNLDMAIGKVDFDSVGGIFEPIMSEITSGIMNLASGSIANSIETSIEENLPKAFEGLIQDSYQIRFNDGVNNHDLAVALNLEAIDTNTNGLVAQVSGGVIPGSPNLNIPQPLAGALYTADELPLANYGSDQFAISINTNVINQTLASAHSVGLTHMNIVGEDVQYGIPRNDDFGDPDAISRILVNNVAPASVRIEEIGGQPRVVFSIFEMEVNTQLKDGNEFNDNLGVKVDVNAPVSIAVTDNNTLDFIIPANPDVNLKAFKLPGSDWSSVGATKVVNELVDNAIGLVLKELTKPVAEISLPTFNCMAVKSATITAVGALKGHLNISGTLEKVSDECDVDIVDPPKVAYGRGAGTPLTCAPGEDYDGGLCYEPCRDTYNGVGPVCWKQNASYDRGVGIVPEECGSGNENDAGLCYPVCRDGYHGVGPVCWSDQKESYGRGVGTIPSNIWTGRCPSGKENDAGLCYPYCRDGYKGEGPVCWLENPSYGRGVGVVPKDCGAGKENDAGLCYPICREGFHGVGPTCWSNDSISYGRGVGKPIHSCRDGEEKDAALCYEQCRQGYSGVGPVCWPINND